MNISTIKRLEFGFQIKAILGYHFEGRNLVVKYEFEPVMELPADEVEKAIAKKRKSIMKLVKKNS